MKKIRVFSFEAHLDSGAIVQVEYVSQYIKPGIYINEVSKCTYQNVDITPCFTYKKVVNEPHGIWEAMENNADFQWNNITEPCEY